MNRGLCDPCYNIRYHSGRTDFSAAPGGYQNRFPGGVGSQSSSYPEYQFGSHPQGQFGQGMGQTHTGGHEDPYRSHRSQSPSASRRPRQSFQDMPRDSFGGRRPEERRARNFDKGWNTKRSREGTDQGPDPKRRKRSNRQRKWKRARRAQQERGNTTRFTEDSSKPVEEESIQEETVQEETVEENFEENFEEWLSRNLALVEQTVVTVRQDENLESSRHSQHLEDLGRREAEARHRNKGLLQQEGYRRALEDLIRLLRRHDELSRDRRIQFITRRNEIIEGGIRELEGCEDEDTFTSHYQAMLTGILEAGTDYQNILQEQGRTYEESWRKWWEELENTSQPFVMKPPFWYPYSYVDQTLLHLNPQIWARAIEKENHKNYGDDLDLIDLNEG